MKEITLKQKEFLKDTISHYNKNNRSSILIDGNDRCTYLSPNDKSEGCAIGRHIRDKELCKRWDELPNPMSSVYSIFDELPEHLKELERYFLLAIQRLHDNPNNWTEKGLSETGKHMANQIEQGKYEYSN